MADLKVEYGPYSGRFWRLTGTADQDFPTLIEEKSNQRRGGPWPWRAVNYLHIGPAESSRVLREWKKALKAAAKAAKAPKQASDELRERVIRLASADPELRPHLLSILSDEG